MANFGGHAIPGSFFLLYGFWLTVKHILQHHWRTNQPKARRVMPPLFRKLDYMEGGFLIFASFVGIMVEQFVVDGPHARLYNPEGKSWVKLMNWQHSTMYLFFGISGMALVASTASKQVPAGLDRLALSLALFVEGFLFLYHLHNRPLLDAHIHSLLLFAVFSASASTMLEVFKRDDIVLELLRAGLFFLQGSWFYQIGFVLYPPNGPKWDLTLHDNVMFVTMCFCWHLAVALLLVAGISSAVWFAVKRFSGRGQDMEMRITSSKSSSQKALLEESDEE
uniref:Transmembrane protein 45B n=1 Tax=Gasterosteus aculeatus aculeatus TaxID=481459 RepID=A0AAQ4RHS1_GASAC|nr:transmembrane protein 45B [Gasterosteus aculeatus aculeatus]